MGRKATPTVRDMIEKYRKDMQPFRRAMKPQYGQHYDHLFDNIRYHAMPANYGGTLDIKWTLMFTACIGQQRQIDQLKERVEELKAGGD